MKKVVIIVLVVFAVIMVAILVVRPGGQQSKVEAPNFVKLLGSLAPHDDVTAAELAGKDCWNESGVLTALPNQKCELALPKANRMKVCLAQGTLDTLRIKGDNYGPQVFDPTKIPCSAGGETFDLYDAHSNFALVCGLAAQCVLRLN